MRDNAELLPLSGLRDPCPGTLGVVEEAALADLPLVDGDPAANLALIEDPERGCVVIMKMARSTGTCWTGPPATR